MEAFLGSALKDEVMKIMPVQKQTRAGQRTRFKVRCPFSTCVCPTQADACRPARVCQSGPPRFLQYLSTFLSGLLTWRASLNTVLSRTFPKSRHTRKCEALFWAGVGWFQVT